MKQDKLCFTSGCALTSFIPSVLHAFISRKERVTPELLLSTMSWPSLLFLPLPYSPLAVDHQDRSASFLLPTLLTVRNSGLRISVFWIHPKLSFVFFNWSIADLHFINDSFRSFFQPPFLTLPSEVLGNFPWYSLCVHSQELGQTLQYSPLFLKVLFHFCSPINPLCFFRWWSVRWGSVLPQISFSCFQLIPWTLASRF